MADSLSVQPLTGNVTPASFKELCYGARSIATVGAAIFVIVIPIPHVAVEKALRELEDWVQVITTWKRTRLLDGEAIAVRDWPSAVVDGMLVTPIA